MILWVAATVIFILLATFVPPVAMGLKTTSLQPADWVLAAAAAIAGTFWIELRKLVGNRTHPETLHADAE